MKIEIKLKDKTKSEVIGMELLAWLLLFRLLKRVRNINSGKERV